MTPTSPLTPASRSPGAAAAAGEVAAAAAAGGASDLPGCTGWIFGAAAVAAVAYGFSRLSAARIGGQTGDTLGAVQQLGEIAFLAVLAMGL